MGRKLTKQSAMMTAEFLTQCVLEGLSMKAIGRKVGCNEANVRRAMKRTGVTPRRQGKINTYNYGEHKPEPEQKPAGKIDMHTWNDLRHVDVREEILNDDMYGVVGRNLSSGKAPKADALIINIEFAKTLGGDVQKILKELGVI